MERIFTNEDCMEVMGRYPDNHFDLAIVDPPYGIGASRPSKKPGVVRQKNGSVLNVKLSQYLHKDWDDSPVGEDYFHELNRVSKKQIVWGANYFGLKGGRLIWSKLNIGTDQFDCEIAHISWSYRTDVIYYRWSGMIQGKCVSKDPVRALEQIGNKSLNEKRIHPTQKPIALYKWLLTNYAKPGDLILDTHVGSASSLIACEEKGFEYVGCELDEDYYQQAQKRLQNFRAQIRLNF